MKKVLRVLLVYVIFMAMLILFNQVYAAGASIRASSTSIKTGESTTVTASVSDTETYSLRMSASGGSLTGNVNHATAFGYPTSQQVLSGTFSASAPGTYTIYLSGTISGDLVNIIDVSQSVTINVSDNVAPTPNPTPNPQPTNKSSNANITGITLSVGELTPAFDKNIKEYVVHVGKEVTDIDVGVIKEHSKATYRAAGTRNLEIGDNIVTITITAEDGKTTNVYKVNVIRSDVYIMPLASLEVVGFILTPEFNKDVYTYTLDLEEFVKALEIIAVAQDENVSVEIVGATDLKEGENTILIILRAEETLDETIYKIIVTMPAEVIAEKEEEPKEEEKTGGILGFFGNITPDQWVAVGVTILTFGTIVMLIVEGYKERRPRLEEAREEARIEEELNYDTFSDIVEAVETAAEKIETLEEEGETRKEGKHF